MALSCVDFDFAKFVDRREELKTLINILSVPAGQNKGSDERVVHLVGKSRVGKSFLLCRYRDHINTLTSVQPIVMSLEDYASFSSAQFAVRVLDVIYNYVASALKIQPANNTGKSPHDLSDDLLKHLDTLQRKKKIVILMDEVDTLSGDQIEALEDYFLAKCLNLPNTVLILTGRHVMTGWKEFYLRPTTNKNVVELFGFDLESTREQIEILNPGADSIAPKIHEISGGSPGNNKRILGRAFGDPLQIVELDALLACNQELYDSLNDLPQNIQAEVFPALQALCVLQDFDKEYEVPVLLAAHPGLNGIWDVRRSASLFNILSGIQVGPGRLVDWDKGKSAYTIEEQIRLNLEKELMLRDKDLWRTLHCTAMKMYAQWAKDYDLDLFESKSEYHKTQLATAGFDPANC